MGPQVYDKVQPAYHPVPNKATRLTGGILHERCAKNIENFFQKIDVGSLKEVYASEHESWYAEPEFCGKYLDTAMEVFGTTGDPQVLAKAEELVGSIIKNQRADGYLGTYRKGLEFDETFSVWNQNFTIMGLLSYYEETSEEKALACAMRCADYLAENFMRPGGPDLLRAINQGIEHACLIRQMPRLYRLTGKKLYPDFCYFIIERLESTTLKLVSIPQYSAWPITSLGCLKAVELLICYQGLLDLYGVTGKEEYLKATTRYWEVVKETQIGVTGNGSISENWTGIGNRMRSVPTELFPNENCVAVGWMKLSAMLFGWLGEARFIDAFEQTLYNHLLGSQALDGSDFSYYQGLIGRKIHATFARQYKCCRYRGLNMLAHLPKYVYAQNDSEFLINLYCPSKTEATLGSSRVSVEQKTDYPRSGRIAIQVRPEMDVRFALRLRIPDWCEKFEARLGDTPLPQKADGGYLTVEREWSHSGDNLELSLDLPSGFTKGKAWVEFQESAACTYGPLVLALDSRYGTPIEDTEIELRGEKLDLERVSEGDEGWTPMVKFKVRGRHRGEARTLQLVDYASAGSLDTRNDRFKVWIPVAEGKGK